MRSRRLFLPVPLAVAAMILSAGPSASQHGPWRAGAVQDVIETPAGKIYKIYNPKSVAKGGGSTPPAFTGDSYSFEHQIGALIDDIFQCFSEHTSGMDDNTVLFDGLSEFLDPYLDGTMPAVFEFETDNGDGTSRAFFNSFSENNGDLFPEGFEDPETGTPLDSACLEIGIDDTLDGDSPVKVNSATFEASNSDGNVIPPVDISSFFDEPWDGRLSVVFQGTAGQGIDGMVLDLNLLQAPDPSAIFSDGFESGDASAWQ